MKKIKVAFIADMLLENADGAIRTMYQIINRIPQERFEFVFLCGVPPERDLGFEVVSLPTAPILVNPSYSMALPFLAERKMAQKLSAFQPDLIHIATPSPLGHFAQKFGQQNNIPIVSIYHTHFLSYVDYYLRKVPWLIPPVKQKFIAYTRSFYNQCELTFVPTQSIIEELSSYGIDPQKMVLWQRGIDQQLFHPNKKEPVLIRKIVGNDRPTILFVSRLVWEKNLETLIQVYQQAEKQQLGYNFLVVGDGMAKMALQTEMPKAHFLGKVDHNRLSIIYASADIFLFPSDTESYGNVVIEAMASGLPCVIANGGGSGSLVQHGENGFSCTPQDATAFLKHIQRIMAHPQLRQQFIASGLEFTQSLDWGKLVNRYFDTIKQIKENSVPLFV